jgi:hypothetical protein
MGTHIISYVVLDVPNGIVNSVVPCEQFITEGHVVVTVLGDIDEGELRRVCTTYIIELRDGSQELVREVLRQTAIQIE